MNREVFATFVGQLRSEAATREVARLIFQRDLAQRTVVLGRAGGLADAVRRVPEKKFHDETVSDVVKEAQIGLTGIYRDSQRRADWTLGISLACAGVAIGVVFIVVVKAASAGWNSGIAEIASTVFPGVLSGTLFALHRGQQKRLKTVEEDIRALDRFKTQLDLVAVIDDPEIRRVAYDRVLSQLNEAGA